MRASAFSTAVEHGLKVALDAAFPARCPGCGLEGEPICSACRRHLYARERLPGGIPIGLPSDVPEPLVQLELCAPFGGTVRAAVHALKYSGERRLAQPLGQAIASRWQHAGAGGDLLVPVPVHAERRRARGYDQAALLTHAAAPFLGLPVAEALRRARVTQVQYELDRKDRAANVRDAFEVRALRDQAAVRGRWVILVDDVVTTGATLAACADALIDAGASAVSAVTLARER